MTHTHPGTHMLICMHDSRKEGVILCRYKYGGRADVRDERQAVDGSVVSRQVCKAVGLRGRGGGGSVRD